MMVLSVNPIGLLIFFLGWAYTATRANVVKVLGMSTIGMVICIFGWLFYRSFYRRQDQLSRVALAVCDEERDDELRSCSEGGSLHRASEGLRNDPILERKHKIFLSHSGAQKEFVEHLCKALEDRLHYPFFDRRHESLPKGERFPELIVRAAEQCEMLIVVVSDEYFMSKWPMIELNAFVRAHKLCHESKSSSMGPKILPLFYGLSIHDLEDASKRKKWFQKWETFAKADPKQRILVHDWKYALDVLGSFNGVPYDANLKEIVAYEEKIVSYVCKSIAVDRKWDDSHVQGKSSIHKVIDEKIEVIGVSRKYKVKVVGIFGVGGVGKTTTCKTMCNELSSKYEGRVCHIEFSSVPLSDSKELFQQVLRDLTRKSLEVIQQMNEGECKNILRSSLPQQKTFLAIDNISDHHRSIQQAKLFLEIPYHIDSLVVVTARSQSVLELLGLDRDACFEMPNLGERDAVNLFLQHAVGDKQFFEDEEKHDIMTCVSRCYFSKGNGEGHHYHPLALQALGLQLGCLGESPCEWVKNLPRVRAFNYLSGGNPVFDILRSSFDILSPRDQTSFMDVGWFHSCPHFVRDSIVEWLCDAHKQDEEELAFRLERLKRKGLLLNVNLKYEKISMHDLYLEFVVLEMNGSFDESINLRERKWVNMMSNDLVELESKLEDGCCSKLIRLCIIGRTSLLSTVLGGFGSMEGMNGFGSMEGMKWDYFSNVEVLRLEGLHWGYGALNLEGLVRLRVLQLLDAGRIDRIEGLGKLKYLTYFVWDMKSMDDLKFLTKFRWDIESDISKCKPTHIVGQLPPSLRRLTIWGKVVLGSDLLADCPNLSQLILYGVEMDLLNLSDYGSLKHVVLCSIGKLRTISGLAINQSSNLKSLVILGSNHLVDVPRIDLLMGLKKLHIRGFPNCEMPNLLALTNLEDLSICGEQRLVVPAKDCFPCQLRKLQWSSRLLSGGLNLVGFNKLEILDLDDNDGLISLAESGDFPALQRFDLSGCKHLLQLPDLSMSRNLRELKLFGCIALELHEKDIQMLSELPLLEPVPFGVIGIDIHAHYFRLDCARGKVLMQSNVWVPRDWVSWKRNEWKEQDLGAGGIQLGLFSWGCE